MFGNKVYHQPSIYSESVIPEGNNNLQGNKQIDDNIFKNMLIGQNQNDVTMLSSNKFSTIEHQKIDPLIERTSKNSFFLLKAIDKNDYKLVEDLLKSESIRKTINFISEFGRTPLTAAINKENYEMVILLLENGARPNVLTVSINTAFHRAIRLKNLNILRALLVYDRKNDDQSFLDFITKKSFNFNPQWTQKVAQEFQARQRTLEFHQWSLESAHHHTLKLAYEYFDALKVISEFYPETIKIFNSPDVHGVTPIQRAGRRGDAELVAWMVEKVTKRTLFSLFVKKNILFNVDASFTPSDLTACQAKKVNLNDLPIDQLAIPLIVAQNNCNTFINLKNGQIVQIPNMKGQEAWSHIQKKLGKITDDSKANVLTLYLNPGHGFLRLNCNNCKQSQPFDETRGFYPSGVAWLTTQNGVVLKEWDHESRSELLNSLKIMFYIDDDQAKAAFEGIEKVLNSCEDKTKEFCQYNAIYRNCVTFVQEIYEEIGGENHFADFFTDEQLNKGYFSYLLNNSSKSYEFKAVSYAYVVSRLHKGFVNIIPYEHIAIKSPSSEKNAMINSSLASQPHQLDLSHEFQLINIDNLLLISVLAVATYKTYEYVSECLSSFGTSFSKEEFIAWHEAQTEALDHLSVDLESMEDFSSEMLLRINQEKKLLCEEEDPALGLSSPKTAEESMLFFTYETDRKKWREISHRSIDLQFDLTILDEKVNQLNANDILPSKKYLKNLDSKIEELSSKCETLKDFLIKACESFDKARNL